MEEKGDDLIAYEKGLCLDLRAKGRIELKILVVLTTKTVGGGAERQQLTRVRPITNYLNDL